MLYDVKGDPPLLEGAVHVITTLLVETEVVGAIGATGTKAHNIVKLDE